MPTPPSGDRPVTDVPYDLHGEFIETCDCYVVCPCWVDDDPDEGHCTGLFAWRTESGSTIDGVDVGGRSVVSVPTHSGNRRRGGTSTALFVDRGASADQFRVLAAAFSGRYDGPLADLAEVSGTVLSTERATIDIREIGRSWAVSVSAPSAPAVPLVHAEGEPRTFDDDMVPLKLSHTALSKELGVPRDPDRSAVTAQLGGDLGVHVGVLPAGWIDVTGRSGMRGAFRYRRMLTKPDPGDE